MNRITSMVLAFALTFAVFGSVAASPPGPGGPGLNYSAVQFRLGLFQLDGDSGFWDDTADVFTLEASDFDDAAVGFSYIRGVGEQLEVGFNADFFEERVRSEYRDFVDIDGYSILHDTELTIVPLTVDFRFVPGGRYRQRPGGRQVPKPLFYVGAGIGITFWEYEEFGDFLDFGFDPPEIFYDEFQDEGAAFEIHALAGVEIPVSRRTNFLIEGRVSDSDDELGGDFSGLPERKIDLGGSSIYAGASIRF